jgi:transposase InsO family protein
MKYHFIEEHKHEFPIVVMCGVLAVSESGFYAWRKRPTCQRKREDAHLKQEIRQVFEEHLGRYGAPRIYRELSDEGVSCSRKRVARLMREEEIAAKRKHHRVVTTKRDETHPVARNLLNREFTASAPNKKWVTDITYIPTKQGWLYLAVMLDLYSRMVVGWSMSGNCDEKLVEHALEQALARRRPAAGLLHHSDRGSQYTSYAYQAYLQKYGIQPSMSRKGNCWDNSVMESFFGTLKDECIGETLYTSHDEARLALFTYIEVYYNRVRRHSTLGYVSPLQYEKRDDYHILCNV